MDETEGMETLKTYTLQIKGPPGDPWHIAIKEEWMQKVADDLAENLPVDYAVQIEEWDAE